MIDGEHGRVLKGKGLERFLRAVGNLDPGTEELEIVFLDRNRIGLRARGDRTRQEWRIGPKGGFR